MNSGKDKRLEASKIWIFQRMLNIRWRYPIQALQLVVKDGNKSDRIMEGHIIRGNLITEDKTQIKKSNGPLEFRSMQFNA